MNDYCNPAHFAASLFMVLTLVLPAKAGEYRQTETLLKTDRSVIGEDLYYPGGGKVEVTSMVVVLSQGEKTIWHKHGVPLYAYILSGELELDYGSAGKRIYRSGDSFMEAMNEFHQGRNIGNGDVRILAVFMGGEDQPLVIKKEH